MTERKQNLSQFNKVKEYKGKKYTGVKVGHGHKWEYEAGEWKETKTAPNKWEFSYKVGKKRRGKAPEGSGAPVGTEYHWYIIADQIVKKLDANNYSTEMTGSKYKVAHKRFDKPNWSINDQKQKNEIIKILKDMIVELETGPEPEVPMDQGKVPLKRTYQTRLLLVNP